MRSARTKLAKTMAVLTSSVLVVGLATLVAGSAAQAESSNKKTKAAATQAAEITQDERCDDDPVFIRDESKANLLPNTMALKITQAQCSGPSDSETPVSVTVSFRLPGDEPRIAAAVDGGMESHQEGGESFREITIHGIPSAESIPDVPGRLICVEINDQETCLPPA